MWAWLSPFNATTGSMLSYLKRTAPHLAIVLLVAGLQWAGVLDRLEFPLMDARFAMLEREASRDIVVVEIDERSLRLLDVWPWPRDYHAQVIDRLHEAGASLIAVDVDFSSRSNENGDAALEAALARAEGSVVLPVFRQYSGLERDRRTLADTGPKPRFAQHVRLGSVAVRPESDSLIRRALTSLPWSGQDVASFPVLLAGIHPGVRSFYIDFGIGSETIPRISYVDVMRGDVTLPGESKNDEENAAGDEKKEDDHPLVERIQGVLTEKVEGVRTSKRLTQSPACLVLAEDAMGAQMRRIMEQSGQTVP